MKNIYANIEKTLKENISNSLELYKCDLHYGVENSRIAKIKEPDPDEGKLVPAGDQSYYHGSRRTMWGYEFLARDATESLDLLEKKCSGEDVKNTATRLPGKEYWDNAYIHGYDTSQGGIDNWINAGIRFEVGNSEGGFEVKFEAYSFPNTPVLSKFKGSSLIETLAPYIENEVSPETPRHIHNGLFMQGKMIEGGRNPISRNAVNQVSLKIGNKMENALKEIEPFGFPEAVQSALMYSIITNELFKVKNN